MSKIKNINGKFALAENSAQGSIVVLIFETPYNVSGEGMAVLGGQGVNSIEEISQGDFIKAAFDDRSILKFDEDIAARKKSNADIKTGNYSGYGILEDSPNCDFVFTSDIIDGKWQILYTPKAESGILSKIFNRGELMIRKLD